MPTAVPMMPTVARPRTRPSGEPFTEDDPEFWELERNGGIRQHVHLAYPAMLYRAVVGDTGKTTTESRVVQSVREREELSGDWCDSPKAALDRHEQLQQDIARAAAEVAHKAQGMSEKARAEYKKRSADSPDHVTQ